MSYIRQFIDFVYQEAMSCIFPVLIFVSLAFLKLVDIPYIPDYDAMLIFCLLIQIMMVRTKLESKDEILVICVFHLIGLILELFKVHMGSWAYPKEAYTKIWGVPLYSGFMYASVASYLCQAWRRLDVHLVNWPKPYITVPLGAAIYLNFMTHHFTIDLRWFLVVALFVVFFRTSVEFETAYVRRRIPLVLGFLLIGFFVWIGENIATYMGAWVYPNQRVAWAMVDFSKITSWSLLVIVSFIIVAQLKQVKGHLKHTR